MCVNPTECGPQLLETYSISGKIKSVLKFYNSYINSNFTEGLSAVFTSWDLICIAKITDFSNEHKTQKFSTYNEYPHGIICENVINNVDAKALVIVLFDKIILHKICLTESMFTFYNYSYAEIYVLKPTIWFKSPNYYHDSYLHQWLSFSLKHNVMWYNRAKLLQSICRVINK